MYDGDGEDACVCVRVCPHETRKSVLRVTGVPGGASKVWAMFRDGPQPRWVLLGVRGKRYLLRITPPCLDVIYYTLLQLFLVRAA